MRVELPEGYVPPEPTHPHYGYLTPEEQEAVRGGARGLAPPRPPRLPVAGTKRPGTRTVLTPTRGGARRQEAEEATVARPGWVPEPPRRHRRPSRRRWARRASTGGTPTGRSGCSPQRTGTRRRRGGRRARGVELVDQRRRLAVPVGRPGAALGHRAAGAARVAVWRNHSACSTLVPAREWRNGRRAGFRCQCPQGRGGSSPPSRTDSDDPADPVDGQPALVEQVVQDGGERGHVRRLPVGVQLFGRLPVLVEEERPGFLDGSRAGRS